MSELRRLLRAYDSCRLAGQASALATVVAVAGSSYRQPGARMLIAADGLVTGAISGGCLEGDARRRARQAMQRGCPVVVTYDSTDPAEDLSLGAQLGCQGIVQILLEPLDYANAGNPVELLRQAAGQDEPAVLGTVFDGPAAWLGQRLLLTAEGRCWGTLSASPALGTHLRARAAAALVSGKSQHHAYTTSAGPVQVLLEVLVPAPRLTVYGAGNDAQPLVRLAAGLGWRVTVVDGRAALATPARFPDAERVEVVSAHAIDALPHTSSWAVLLTHNYHYDLAVLRHLLPAPPPYIGLLGPRQKYERLLTELRQAVPAAAELLAGCLHSPIGLNLGAETPEEIALAIVAEIQAVRAARPAGFLRDSPLPIHSLLHSEGNPAAQNSTTAAYAL